MCGAAARQRRGGWGRGDDPGTAATGLGDGVWRDLDRLQEIMPELRHILLVGGTDPARGFDDALAGVGTEAPLAGLTGPEDVVVTMLTGGTTGLPSWSACRGAGC